MIFYNFRKFSIVVGKIAYPLSLETINGKEKCLISAFNCLLIHFNNLPQCTLTYIWTFYLFYSGTFQRSKPNKTRDLTVREVSKSKTQNPPSPVCSSPTKAVMLSNKKHTYGFQNFSWSHTINATHTMYIKKTAHLL